MTLFAAFIFIGRLIMNRNDCYGDSLPVYILKQLFIYECPEPLHLKILGIYFNVYAYISLHYMNYLILATPSFSSLSVLINNNYYLIPSIFTALILLAWIFAILTREVGKFLGINDY